MGDSFECIASGRCEPNGSSQRPRQPDHEHRKPTHVYFFDPENYVPACRVEHQFRKARERSVQSPQRKLAYQICCRHFRIRGRGVAIFSEP